MKVSCKQIILLLLHEDILVLDSTTKEQFSFCTRLCTDYEMSSLSEEISDEYFNKETMGVVFLNLFKPIRDCVAFAFHIQIGTVWCLWQGKSMQASCKQIILLLLREDILVLDSTTNEQFSFCTRLCTCLRVVLPI